jgi:signal transduction histidine kinase
MFEFFKSAVSLIKQYPAVLYSVALVILLPLALFVSTFITINSLVSQINAFLQSHSLAVEQTITVFFQDSINKPVYLQQKIDQLDALANKSASNDVPEFENLRILVKNGADFTVIASQDKTLVGQKVSSDPNQSGGDSVLALSYADGQSIVRLTSQDGKQFWQIIQPLFSSTNEVVGVASLMIPLDDLNSKITKVVQQSYLILSLVIFLTLFLIYQHTRLFSFVLLSNKLKDLDKLKDQFVRMATHELQSPVTTIRGYVEELKDELATVTNDEQKEYLNRISLSAKNLSDLIFDILEVSHLQQGRMDFEPQLVSPAKIAADIVGNVRLKAEAKGLKLIIEGADCPYLITVNETRFKQIVTNLIENSIKYTLKGEVKVSVMGDKAKKRVVVLVQDTGFGISAEGQAHLFEQFYRVKTQENAGIPGTGLGLWMSKQMAQKMKGDIFIESIERVGSRFFVVFPMTEKK